MAVKSTHADQERRNTMADTKRKKRKKPFMADYVEHHRKKEEAAKKAKKAEKDKKEREEHLRAAERLAANLDRLTDISRKKKFKPEDLTERELDIGSDRDTKGRLERANPNLSDKGVAELFYDISKGYTDKKSGGVVKRKKKPTVAKKNYSRGSRKAKYNG